MYREKVPWFAVLALLFMSGTDTMAKSKYADGNYSDNGEEGKNCMRCHMGVLNPSGVTLNISSSSSSVTAGNQLNISATRTNFPAIWKPGIAIHAELNSPYASRTPVIWGWEVISNSNGTPFSYIKVNGSSATLTWTLKAPQRPGVYRFATSAYFNDGDTLNPNTGTERGDNSITVTVNRATESVKPVLNAVAGYYKIYVFLSFSEPIDEVSAQTLSNYVITNTATSQTLALTSAFASRDGKTVVLRTAAHEAGANYSLLVRNLQDYAQIPNTIDQTVRAYTPDPAAAYKLYAEWTQDVTSAAIMQLDQVEYLGNNAGAVHRLNLGWHVPGSPVDLLPGIPFFKATLHIRQVTTSQTAASQAWDAHRLLPGANWYDYVGNDQTVAQNWSGYNQVNPAIASLSHAVMTVNNGSPETWWTWDITGNFRTRYENPGGVGTNASDYFLRLKARNEAGNIGGAGFYGSDANSVTERPYIALELDTSSGTGAIKALQGLSPVAPVLSFSPNPGHSGLAITFSLPGSRGGWSELSIYRMDGRKIKTLLSGENTHGEHTLIWDGKNESGRPVPAGIYLMKLQGPATSTTRELVYF